MTKFVYLVVHTHSSPEVLVDRVFEFEAGANSFVVMENFKEGYIKFSVMPVPISPGKPLEPAPSKTEIELQKEVEDLKKQLEKMTWRADDMYANWKREVRNGV
jgi:hypothetical protein